jgi:hypothetical protein
MMKRNPNQAIEPGSVFLLSGSGAERGKGEMKVAYTIRMATALRLGVEPGEREYEIEVGKLTAEERQRLYQALSASNTRVDVNGDYLAEDSAQGLVAAIGAQQAAKAEEETQSRTKRMAEVRAWIAAGMDMDRVNYIRPGKDGIGIEMDLRSNGSSVRLTGDEAETVRQACAAHEAAKEAEEAEEKAAKAAKEAKEKAAKEAEEKERLDWIAEHGSARLKLCVAHEIECEAIYRDERLAFERPGYEWYDGIPGQCYDPRNPPLAALEALEAERQTAPDAELVYYKIEEETDDGGEVVEEEWTGYAIWHELLGDAIVKLLR